MLQPTHALLEPETLDYVVVIGGILHAGPQIDEATTRYLREVGASSTWVGCSMTPQLAGTASARLAMIDHCTCSGRLRSPSSAASRR